MMRAPIAAGAGLLIALLLTGGIAAVAASEVEDIHVVALFKDRAVVMIGGTRRLLRAGDTSPEGLKLVSADSGGAVLEYRGQVLERGIDGRARAPSKAPAGGNEVHVYRDAWGMYKTVGSINGMPVSFLVDTGASAVAMNSSEARRLGIDFRVDGNPTYVATASDVRQAYKVELALVKVGQIQLRNVVAVVMDGPQPSDVLLGMSFLGRLEMINQGDRLTLRRKY